MEALFQTINQIFSFVIPVSDFFWEFPTNFEWYANIPILGNFSLAIIVLVGSGLYFSFRLGFIQVRRFGRGCRLLAKKKSEEIGLSSLAAFLLSSAMRIGPGNILGVTGAISIGGPGALFWMWVSAFFGMATAYTEATLAQMFKEKKGDEYVGGLPYYGRKLMGNRAWVGVLLSIMFIIYAMCCLPAQGYNVVSAVGQIGEYATGTSISTTSALYFITAIVLIVLTAYIAFGGTKKVSRVTDKVVPVMAVIYIVTIIALIFLNVGSVPYFFGSVFGGAFKPQAVFGGMFGTALAQGIKRGLMSNEAGQGTITMAAATASTDHPCEQGLVQIIGVFFDTIVICTMTGFIVVMAHCWTGADGAAWMELDKLPKFLTSAAAMTPGQGAADTFVAVMTTISFMLFAFTCLIGFFSFSDIAVSRITRSTGASVFVRILGICITIFGILSSMAGIDLGNLWSISDLGNILIVYANVPLLYRGFGSVLRATKHYMKEDGTPFNSGIAGISCPYWDEREKQIDGK